MKRPKTSSKKIGWFSIASVFLLAAVLAVGIIQTAMAATGSFDRDNYLPEYTDTGGNDFDRAFISVTDSSGNTTASQDTITVTIKASASHSVPFVLKETGGNSGIFTTTGGTTTTSSLPFTYPVGTTAGYVEDFNTGSHNYPALGTSVVGLNLRDLTADTGGVGGTSDGNLTVATGNTLELLYSASTLDTASVKTNSGSFSFSPSSVSAVTTNSGVSVNLIVSLTDGDENLNPAAKDVIGFADRVALLSGSPGTGSSRVQIEAIDQTTGSQLSLGGTSIIARNIVLVETGNNTGVFTASGKVFGTSTTVSSSDLKGNVLVGSSSTSEYTGQAITLGTTTTGAVKCTFRIIEANASGRIGLYEANESGTATGQTPVTVLGFTTGSNFSSKGTSTFGIAGVTSGITTTRVVAMGTTTTLFGAQTSSANQATSTSGLIKLIEGSNYCLVAISSFEGTSTFFYGSGTTYELGQGGSVTVTFSNFQLAGPRAGDTLKVSYLDELNVGGTSGTVTGTLAYGVAGETGTLAADKTAVDINDYLTVTVVDGNLNTSSSSKESVAAASSLWGGTTTDNRGDRLTVKAYNASTKQISVSHPDGSGVGTQTVRISNTDNSLVWMVPSSLTGTFMTPLSFGSTTFSLGTESVSSVPLVKGSSSTADSFLTSASTSSFLARLDGLDNTVEVSPDGTRWISVPIVESGANSSTYVGTIGFDYTASRLTTNTSTSVTSLISDFTGTSTLLFQDLSASTSLAAYIGTGSVVRIFDGSVEEFAEVTSSSDTSLTVTKLTNSTAFDPDKTYVQVVGNDMMTQRLDTTSAGTVFFRIGGICGGTYRIRYNDAVGASNAYMGGDTLAITTSNFGFTDYTAELSTDITGTSGPDTFVVVTLFDQDLNTATGSKQSTYEADSTSSGTGAIIFNNENGLGLPSGTSTGNTSRGFKNGATAKILYASTLSNILNSSVNQASGGNTIDFTLVETANDSGTFKGSFQLSSSTSTTNSSDLMKVSNGNSVYVFYNDSPSAAACDNSSTYMSTGPISIVTSLGTLSLSKETAYLSGDSVVATVVDVDRNTSLTSADTLSTALKVTGSNFSVGTDLNLNLVETGVNSSTFVATFQTGTTTNTGVTPQIVKAIQGGILNVVYTDTSPSSSSATKSLSLSAFNATMEFDADSYPLGNYAVVTLADAERNTSITTAQSLLSDVFIQTSSANSTKVRMVETGADTGTFKGSIQVASSGGTTEFSRIQAAEGDTLTITYLDEVNTTGSSRTVTDTATVTEAVATPTPTPGPATPTPTPGPTATPTATPPPVTGGIIVGSVVTEVAPGQTVPIEGATISTDTGGYTATTGPDGSYRIDNVAAGAYLVTASATGFDSSSQPVTVVEGVVSEANFTLVPTPTTPPPTTPTPTVTPTPPVCEPELVSVSPSSLKLKRKKSSEVAVTVTGANDCPVEGETVTATINAAGKKVISVLPTSAATDASGAATFTITAKKKTGNARVTYKAGDVKKSQTVRVRK